MKPVKEVTQYNDFVNVKRELEGSLIAIYRIGKDKTVPQEVIKTTLKNTLIEAYQRILDTMDIEYKLEDFN